jgi:hypothetical protein
MDTATLSCGRFIDAVQLCTWQRASIKFVGRVLFTLDWVLSIPSGNGARKTIRYFVTIRKSSWRAWRITDADILYDMGE